MKKIMTTAMIAFLVFGLLLSVYIPTVHANPAVMINSYTISPEILMPGDTAILTLQVKNGETVATQTSTSVVGTETTTIVRTLGVDINNIYIVAAQSGGKQIRATTNCEDVGYLAAGASIEVDFKIVVDKNMSEGIYFPKAYIDISSGTDVLFPLLMKVSNSSVDLLSTSVPSKISIGGATEMTITAVNTRENTVDSVLITPQADNVEFSPKSYFLGSLAAKTSEEVTFSVKPLEPGSENLSFDMSYKNGDNLHTNTLVVPIEVIETLDVAPIITSFPLSITKGGSAKINIEVYNAKTEEITGVIITPISEATVVPSEYFIGTMDPDDVFSATFDIYTDTLEYGTYTIGFQVSFKQNSDYYQTPVKSISFEVIAGIGTSYQSSGSSTPQSTAQSALQPPSLVTCVLTLVIIIIVIVVLIILYVKWKKRRNAA